MSDGAFNENNAINGPRLCSVANNDGNGGVLALMNSTSKTENTNKKVSLVKANCESYREGRQTTKFCSVCKVALCKFCFERFHTD